MNWMWDRDFWICCGVGMVWENFPMMACPILSAKSFVSAFEKVSDGTPSHLPAVPSSLSCPATRVTGSVSAAPPFSTSAHRFSDFSPSADLTRWFQALLNGSALESGGSSGLPKDAVTLPRHPRWLPGQGGCTCIRLEFKVVFTLR